VHGLSDDYRKKRTDFGSKPGKTPILDAPCVCYAWPRLEIYREYLSRPKRLAMRPAFLFNHADFHRPPIPDTSALRNQTLPASGEFPGDVCDASGNSG
jgi:hypothetical protein